MPGLRAGELNRQVKIQSRTVAADATGDAVQTWADVATVWAKLSPLSGRELFQAQQVQTDVTHRVLLRHRPDVALSTAHRLVTVEGSRVLEIASVVNVEDAGVYWDVLAVERE